jgi:adenylylsulfate kinase
VDSRARSIAKAITWRAIATAITAAVAFCVVGRWEVAGAIAVIDGGAKLVAYYVHERQWAVRP